jgi:hypothetical protein
MAQKTHTENQTLANGPTIQKSKQSKPFLGDTKQLQTKKKRP